MLDPIFAWLKALPFAQAISISDWLFPSIETVHVMALAAVVGTIGMVDLRLLGVIKGERPALLFAHQVLPWTWAGFGLALVSGFLMFSSNPADYAAKLPFQIKMVLMLVVGLNMLTFHAVMRGQARRGGDLAKLPLPAKLSAGLSLALWVSIVVAGRWIGFV